MATRTPMSKFVFCRQVKFIFGTLRKQKSINYFVAIETSFPCYSPGDVLIWYICFLRKHRSDIRKCPQEQFTLLKISPSPLTYKSLSNPQIFYQILLYIALNCEMMVILHDSARSSMVYVAPTANFKDL